MWQRHIEAVQFLLVRGSDVNARDDCGYSALHLSAEHGYVDIMSILLEYQVSNSITTVILKNNIYLRFLSSKGESKLF